MMYYNLGIIIIFILYFIYDLNSIHWHLKIFNKLFMIGSIAFIVLNGLILYKFLPTITITFINVFLLIFAIAFLGLLIYTLFFALPFTSTYVKISSKPKVVRTGVYSLSRHIGVFWFILMYLCIGIVINATAFTVFASLACLLNILYIIFQDNYTFMIQFDDYADYKKTVPFLIPNFKNYQHKGE